MSDRPIADHYKKALFALLGVTLAIWQWRPIHANDIWWHLASGRYIVEHRLLPRIDVFSFTVFHHPWINHEWLFQILAYLSFREMGGITGLFLLKAFLMLLAFGLIAHYLISRKIPILIGWGILVLAFWATRFAWNLRADLVSIVFITALSCHLAAVRQDDQEYQRLRFWMWPLGFTLWANMHGGFILGLAVILAFGAGFLLERRPNKLILYGWIALCALATFINPWGYNLHYSLWQGVAALRTGFILEWMKTPRHPLEFFWGCLTIHWVFWGVSAWRRRGIIPWSLVLVNLVLSWSAIQYVRNVPYFMLGGFPFIADQWVFWKRQSIHASALAALFTLFFALKTSSQIQGGIDERWQPVKACSFISFANLPGRFYNDYDFGGYWMWHFGAERPVFIDGRLHTVDGYMELYHRMEAAQGGPPKEWDAFLQSYDVDGALVAYPKNPTIPAVLDLYFPRTRWAMVYRDNTAMIFLRRTLPNEPWIRRYEGRPAAMYN